MLTNRKYTSIAIAVACAVVLTACGAAGSGTQGSTSTTPPSGGSGGSSVTPSSTAGGSQGAASSGAAASGSGSAGASTTSAVRPDSMTTVSFALAVPAPDPGQVWFYAPQGYGYFKSENLTVTPQFNNGGGAAITQVVSGNAQFGETSPENLINAVAAGEPLVGFATIITKSIYSVGVKSDSPIKTYADLKGKTMGVSSLTSGSHPFALEALSQNGLTPNKDVAIAVAGNGVQAADAISTGKVDAMTTTDTQWVAIENLGVKPRFLPAPTAASLPADVLFTRQDYLQSHQDVAVAFARAVLEGLIAASANPSRAIDDYYSAFSTAANSKDKATNLKILNSRLRFVQISPAQNGKWGYLPLSQYEQVQTLGVKFGSIKKSEDLSKVLTDSLIDKIDTFDPSAIQKSARS